MVIAVDFDGTLAKHEFPRIGDEVPGAFGWLRKFQECGCTLILWTLRSERYKGVDKDTLTEAVDWCLERGIVFDYVNERPQDWTTSPKVYADLYIDDAAVGCPRTFDSDHTSRPYVDWSVVGPWVMQAIEIGSLPLIWEQ